MADVTVTPTTLTEGTATADLVGAGESVNAAQSFSIDVKNRTDRLLLIFEEEGSGNATVTIDAGDNPPALRAGLGARTVALTNADFKQIVIEAARHMQDDGTIQGSVATNDVYVTAQILPNTI